MKCKICQRETNGMPFHTCATASSDSLQKCCSARPIETAPKSGRILLFLEDCDWVIGEWNPYAFDGPRWEDDGLQPEAFICNPTHWMHLPEPPNRKLTDAPASNKP